MSKQQDFGNELAALNDNVTAELGDVLQVLQEKRTVIHPPDRRKAQEPVANDPGGPRSTSTVDTKPIEQAGATSSRRQRSKHRSRLNLEIERSEMLENVTTRLTFQTNELLTEAALRQRLKKLNPATRQDIIEAALTEWFRKNGYSASGNNDGKD
jgi:hypothetical protein